MNDDKLGDYRLFLQKTESTNTYASQDLPPADRHHGLMVYTYNQTAGRGQRSNKWESAANKNLSFSLILSKLLPTIDQQFILNSVFSLGILRFLSEFDLEEIQIKWPNDVWVNQKKISGILIENSIQRNVLREVIVGIGLNVNQTKFPDNILATSLKLETGVDYDLDEMLDLLVAKINIDWENYISLGSKYLLDRYNENLMSKDGWTHFKVVEDGRLISAQPIEVLADGRIVLKNKQNTRLLFRHGDIIWLGQEQQEGTDDERNEDDFLGI